MDVSAATIAVFSPDAAEPCNSVMPFPSDLSKDPETGLLDIPFCGPSAAEPDDATTTAFKTGLRTLDGFSINTSITIPFSGPIDTTTLDDAVMVINSTTGAQHPVMTMFDATENTAIAIPTTPFAERTLYVVVVTNAVKAADGSEIVSDQAFTFLKSTEPLIDDFGYSAYASLDDATANALEQLRSAWSPLLDGVAPLGLTRDNILVTWFFTTQTVADSYRSLAALVGGGATVTYENTIAAVAHPLVTGAGIPTTHVCKIHSGHVTLKNLLTESGTFGLTSSGAPMVSDVSVDYVLMTPNPTTVDCSGADAWDFQNVVVFSHTLSKCKNVALAMAEAFGAANWAVLALDGPRAGARIVGNLGDQDLDTCLDQPDTPELIALGDDNPNPWSIRDHMRQWGLEIVQTARAANTDVRVFAMADPSGSVPDTNVALVGHSWGGMATILAGSVINRGITESDDYVANVVAVSTASGGMANIFTPLLQAGIAEQLVAAGMTPETPAYAEALKSQTKEVAAIYGWALEPADPLNAVKNYPAAGDLPVLVQVVSSAEEEVARVDAPLHVTADQQNLAEEFAAAGHTSVTFYMECAEGPSARKPICDDDGGQSVVGSLLAPCAEEDPDDLAYNRTVELQTQIVTFVATHADATPTVVPPTTPLCP